MKHQHTTAILGLVLIFVTSVVVDGQTCGYKTCTNALPYCCLKSSAPYCAASARSCVAKKYCGGFSCSVTKPHCCGKGSSAHCARSPSQCIASQCGNESCDRLRPFCCKIEDLSYCVFSERSCVYRRPCGNDVCFRSNPYCCKTLSGSFCTSNAEICERAIRTTTATITEIVTTAELNPRFLSGNGTTIKAPWLWTKAVTSNDSTADSREESSATPSVVTSTSISMERPFVIQSPEPPLSRTSFPTNFAQTPVTVSKPFDTTEDSSKVAQVTTEFEQAFTKYDSRTNWRTTTSFPVTTSFEETSVEDVSEINRSTTISFQVQATQSDASGFPGFELTTSTAVDTNSTLMNHLPTKDDAGAVPAAATAAAGSVGIVILVAAITVAFALLKLIPLFVSFYNRKYRNKNEVYDINSSPTTSCWGSSERGDVKMISKSSSPQDHLTIPNVYENEFFVETRT